MNSKRSLAVGWCIMLLSALLVAIPASSARADQLVARFSARRGAGTCRNVELNQSNVVGFMSVEDTPDTVSAHVLYRSRGRSSHLDLRLMKRDAEALRSKIRELIHRERSRPIRFVTARAPDGVCQVSRVVG